LVYIYIYHWGFCGFEASSKKGGVVTCLSELLSQNNLDSVSLSFGFKLSFPVSSLSHSYKPIYPPYLPDIPTSIIGWEFIPLNIEIQTYQKLSRGSVRLRLTRGLHYEETEKKGWTWILSYPERK